jgi:hypothetical protein
VFAVRDNEKKPASRVLSLSTYYPADTQYFYGYPAGSDSGFLNNVPPEVEELVSMRAISCAGPSVSVISYSATDAPDIDSKLLKKLNFPKLDLRELVCLPADITPELRGPARNEAVKQALKSVCRDRSLVMAQPYLSRRLAGAYQISPDITLWVNDKNNLQKLVSKAHSPRRLATFMDGAGFARGWRDIELPAVVKVASSSSGDGVYICRSRKDMDDAASAVRGVSAPILVEQYVEAVWNYGLHFGIPHDPGQPVDIIGLNEQLTSETGEFEGGIIRSGNIPAELSAVKHYLEYVCLPKVRKMGWYGIGCFDVLVDKGGACYIVDSNFRMTGMTAYHFMVANGRINPPLIGFSGGYRGSRQEFEDAILPFTDPRSGAPILQMIALNEHGDMWRFNAALMFRDEAELAERCTRLCKAGIESDLLQRYVP